MMCEERGGEWGKGAHGEVGEGSDPTASCRGHMSAFYSQVGSQPLEEVKHKYDMT